MSRATVRRSALVGAALLAALAAVVAFATTAASAAAAPPRPSGVVVPASTTPLAGVVSRDAPLPTGERVLNVDPGREFDLVGALVRGVRPPRLRVAVALRTSSDGATWSDWASLDFSASGGPSGSAFDAADTVSEPLWIGRARYAQVRLSGDDAATAAVAATLRLACVTSPWETPASPAASAAPGEPPANVAANVAPRQPDKPTIVTRSQWGANESWRAAAPVYGAVKLMFVHHTVSSNTYTRDEAPAIVRSIYYYHTKVNGWNDIGYNFLVDRFGTIYEGRYGGMTKAVIGAQCLGFNSVSAGVSVIGTFTSVAPPQAAVDALERLIAWKLDVHHVNPQTTTIVQCQDAEKFPAGAWVRFNTISGHRQANYTTCPGNGLFNLLPDIRSAVAGIGNPKIYNPRASPTVFSPNGDGDKDTSDALCGLSVESDWTVTVANDLGQTVRTLSGHGTSVSAAWNGRDGDGTRLPDGVYRFAFAATADGHAARPGSASVRIDTGAPSVSDARCTPAVVSPNGDGLADGCRLLFGVGEACRVRVSIYDAGNALVRRVSDWTSVPAGTNGVVWDGKVTSADGLKPAADGAYRVRVEARDTAGNTATTVGALLVDSSVGFPKPLPPYFSPNGDGVKETTQLGFTLARQARTTVTVSSDAGRLRSWSLGTLAAGAQAARWDGRSGAGVQLKNGRYTFAVTAVNDVGSVTVKGTVVIDRYRPRPATAVASATCKLGSAWKLAYSVSDPYSPTLHARVTVTDAGGAVVSTADLGWVARKVEHTWSFKAVKKGRYTVTVRAVDSAGNHESTPAAVSLTVR